MSDFITLDLYAQHENKHGGWEQALSFITEQMEEHLKKSTERRVVEFGPGPGLSTRRLVDGLRRTFGKNSFKFECVDNDSVTIDWLNKLFPISEYPELRINQKSILEIERQEFDSFVSMFSFSHLVDADKIKLLNLLKSLLSNGVGYICDEFLPEQLETSEAYWTHHETVIFDAIYKGNLELAILEMEALHSGIHSIGDFKTSCKWFECVLVECGFSWSKIKTFPTKEDFLQYSAPMTLFQVKSAEIWKKNSGQLFESIINSEGSNFKPSNDCYAILKEIFSKICIYRDSSEALYDSEAIVGSDFNSLNCGVYLYTFKVKE